MKRANGASLETPQEIRKADGIKNTKNIPFGKKNKKKGIQIKRKRPFFLSLSNEKKIQLETGGI